MSDLRPPPLSSPSMNQAPAKRGMSGCLKAVIIVGIFGVIALVGLGLLVTKFVKDGMSTEPAEVKLAVAAMVDMELGPEWIPAMKMNMGFMRVVAYGGSSGGILMLMESSQKLFPSKEDFEKKMRGEMGSQGDELEATRELSSRRETFRVGNTDQELLLIESEGKDSGALYFEVSGTVPAKRAGKLVYLYVRQPKAEMSIDELKRMFSSEVAE